MLLGYTPGVFFIDRQDGRGYTVRAKIKRENLSKDRDDESAIPGGDSKSDVNKE